MALYSHHSDPIICKMFPSTLEWNRMKWYVGLSSRSITNFITLCDEFMKAFSMYKEVKCTKDTLFLICRRDNKSLIDYIK